MLPRVAGEGRRGRGRPLLTLLARFPAIAGASQTAERVGGRRWTLHLDGRQRRAAA